VKRPKEDPMSDEPAFPPPPFCYGEPPPPGARCEYKLCACTAVVTLQTRECASGSRMLTQRLCAAHHVVVLGKIITEINPDIERWMPGDDAMTELPDTTLEYVREQRGEILMKIERITAFLEGRGAFPVADFLSMEEMSQAEV
jgi:hypothetical protein